MVNIAHGPLVALVLALAEEHTNLLQASHDQFVEEGDHNAAKAASNRLERICMLTSIVEMMLREQTEAETKPAEPTPVEAITAYLQEHDPDTFPISIREDGKLLLLDTRIGISGNTGLWLDEHYPGIVAITKPARSTATEVRYDPSAEAARECAPFVEAIASPPKPAFIPERQMPPPANPLAPRFVPHKREINPGMPMEGGDPQGMPGGRKS